MQDVVKGRNPKHGKNQKGMDGIICNYANTFLATVTTSESSNIRDS